VCYAIPGRLVAINGSVGVIDYYGELRNARVDCTPARVGDYVYAQGGVLISTVPVGEAEETIRAWREMFFTLKERDAAAARPRQHAGSARVLMIAERVSRNRPLSRDEYMTLLSLEDPAEQQLIHESANAIRQRVHGNACCVHGIIEFSSFCQSDCSYCGIRRSRSLDRFRMDPDEIIAQARVATAERGFKSLVLQSGEDDAYDSTALARVVSAIRAMGVLVFVSLGDRDASCYEQLYAAGARGVLLRFETADPARYADMRPGRVLDDRLRLIRACSRMGYVLATGFLFGLPDETPEDVLANIDLAKSLEPAMYSFGPFIPTAATPLAAAAPVPAHRLLTAIAVARINDPQANIVVTTAAETLDPSLKRRGLCAGGNSLMLLATPPAYCARYAIYDNRAGADGNLDTGIRETVRLLEELGRAPTDIGLSV